MRSIPRLFEGSVATILKVFTNDLYCRSSAVFSPDYVYRYRLRRTWDEERGWLHWLMLNPSTADEAVNDPTLERCERRSAAMGYGGFIVTNLFAFRSPFPDVMFKHPEPIGEENDRWILQAARECDRTVCGWGVNGNHLGRSDAVRQMLRDAHILTFALAINDDGSPCHPLYLPYDLEPMPWAA